MTLEVIAWCNLKAWGLESLHGTGPGPGIGNRDFHRARVLQERKGCTLSERLHKPPEKQVHPVPSLRQQFSN